MNTKTFNGLYNTLAHELSLYEFSHKSANLYIFKRNDKFLSIYFDLLLDIKVYKKVYSDGVAVDLDYIYSSAYNLTSLQTNKVAQLVKSKI